MTELAERLGYGPDARLLIINCDDLGVSQAANAGVYESLRTGLATSASLMVPAPWARDAAWRYRGEDIGVHLTLNAEFERYRWGPITQAPSLLDGDGGFPRTIEDLWDHADLDEVRRELRAQIERAILWGHDVSHLDSHMGALQLRPEFFDIYLDLGVEFGLPLRLSGPTACRLNGVVTGTGTSILPWAGSSSWCWPGSITALLAPMVTHERVVVSPWATVAGSALKLRTRTSGTVIHRSAVVVLPAPSALRV